MPAFMVTFVTAHSLDWVPDYLVNVPAIALRYGGEFVGISKAVPGAVECVEGSATPPGGMVVFRFPSMADLKGFLASPDYGPYQTARIAATESTFFAFENDPDAPQYKVAAEAAAAGVGRLEGEH
jgi:uncharacterized protein (DUF1330 family)